MARSSEKAMAVLNRWYQLKHDIVTGSSARAVRPRAVGEVETVRDCERWRHQVVRAVAQKIAEIQNPGLGEHRIRDLNDEINQLVREKERWEARIADLGGPDYRRAAGGGGEALGYELPGHSGRYKYFGAARDLPGIKELFEEHAAQLKASASVEDERAAFVKLAKTLPPDYYGWGVSEGYGVRGGGAYHDFGEPLVIDGLEEAEAMRGKELLEEAQKAWEARQRAKQEAKQEAEQVAKMAGET